MPKELNTEGLSPLGVEIEAWRELQPSGQRSLKAFRHALKGDGGVDVSDKAVYFWRVGKHPPDAAHRVGIAVVLGKDIAEIDRICDQAIAFEEPDHALDITETASNLSPEPGAEGDSPAGSRGEAEGEEGFDLQGTSRPAVFFRLRLRGPGAAVAAGLILLLMIGAGVSILRWWPGFEVSKNSKFAIRSAPECSLSITPTSIQPGDVPILAWASHDAENGAISDIRPVRGAFGLVLVDGGLTEIGTHTYYGSFAGPGGRTQCSASVAVVPGIMVQPPASDKTGCLNCRTTLGQNLSEEEFADASSGKAMCILRADPATVRPGQELNLTWISYK